MESDLLLDLGYCGKMRDFFAGAKELVARPFSASELEAMSLEELESYRFDARLEASERQLVQAIVIVVIAANMDTSHSGNTEVLLPGGYVLDCSCTQLPGSDAWIAAHVRECSADPEAGVHVLSARARSVDQVLWEPSATTVTHVRPGHWAVPLLAEAERVCGVLYEHAAHALEERRRAIVAELVAALAPYPDGDA